MIWFILLGLLIATLLYWELKICEASHLGRKPVTWLYELFASRYDAIKAFDPTWEQHFLGEAIGEVLSWTPKARMLDVGAGTGRAGRAFLPGHSLDGLLVNLEPARSMLKLGRQFLHASNTPWVQAFAVPLPFAKQSFDVVSCLEVLEFTPRPTEALREMVRVLKPGGWLLISNRIGWEARLIRGKTWTPDVFPGILEDYGLKQVEVFAWQVDYDLAWARKPFEPLPAERP